MSILKLPGALHAIRRPFSHLTSSPGCFLEDGSDHSLFTKYKCASVALLMKQPGIAGICVSVCQNSGKDSVGPNGHKNYNDAVKSESSSIN